MQLRVALLSSASGTLFRGLPGLAPTFLVVAMLACVLVPLPTALVDLLLSISLAGAVLLLVAGLSIRKTTDFLTFPSLLLLATLYRLALNVSTTRLILSQADAGRVVDAFAGFVVRGDMIVGGVMFAIITVVQYVVIARGAERVAEVAARFALDGLPGHQAAIDADLRAGVFSPREAARRRADLAERSSFYGAMDGAVRFVKGDAIAGLAITAINLGGGLAIGMGRMGYTWQQSLEVYGRLTVGDGLLAQIPALLVSLAAGVLVSRVDREGDPSGPPRMWLEPAMLIVPAVMLLGLALVPEMPSLAFITIAGALVVSALLLAGRLAGQRLRSAQASSPRRVSARCSPADVLDRSATERALSELQLQCSRTLNVDVPEIVLGVDGEAVPGVVEVWLDDRRCATATVARRSFDDDVVLATYRAIMNNADSLIDLQDLDAMIEQVRASHPVVVKRALDVVDLADGLAVVRGFLRERIPLPPLSRVLGVLAEHRGLGDPSARAGLPELVRGRLALHWLPPLLDAVERVGAPIWIRLTPDAEEEILEHTTQTVEGPIVALGPSERAAWLAALSEAAELGRPDVAEADAGPRRPLVIMATPRARWATAVVFAGHSPHIPVFATSELAAVGELPSPHWLAPP